MDGLSTPLSFRREPSLALVTDAVHRQVFEITVTLRLHPQSGRYADPGVGQNRACCSHTIARLQYAPWRKGVPPASACKSCRSCDMATC